MKRQERLYLVPSVLVRLFICVLAVVMAAAVVASGFYFERPVHGVCVGALAFFIVLNATPRRRQIGQLTHWDDYGGTRTRPIKYRDGSSASVCGAGWFRL